MKKIFNDIASKEKENIDYKLLSRRILVSLRNVFSFLNKYGDLYNFWINVLDHNVLEQVEFLKYLMIGFKVSKTTKKPKRELNYKAKDLYLILLGNPNKTVNNIFLNKPTDKYNKKIYLQAKILFDLREETLKKLFNKRIIKSDSDQLDTEEYEETIAERTKLRKQTLDKIKGKEQNRNNKLFIKYFNYQSPSNMYNVLSDTKNTEEHSIQVNLIKNGLIDLKKAIGNESKDGVNKIKEMNKIADIVELILYFNNDDQQGKA